MQCRCLMLDAWCALKDARRQTNALAISALRWRPRRCPPCSASSNLCGCIVFWRCTRPAEDNDDGDKDPADTMNWWWWWRVCYHLHIDLLSDPFWMECSVLCAVRMADYGRRWWWCRFGCVHSVVAHPLNRKMCCNPSRKSGLLHQAAKRPAAAAGCLSCSGPVCSWIFMQSTERAPYVFIWKMWTRVRCAYTI